VTICPCSVISELSRWDERVLTNHAYGVGGMRGGIRCSVIRQTTRIFIWLTFAKSSCRRSVNTGDLRVLDECCCRHPRHGSHAAKNSKEILVLK
jgi:hypothetical protein